MNKNENKLTYLVVAAHPDDEVLGAGATIKKLTGEGYKVAVAIMSSKADQRANRSSHLKEEMDKVRERLGITQYYLGDFPNLKMNSVPHVELVKFIENCISDFGADAIITHSPVDTNDDHLRTSKAVQAASRLFQRKEGVKRLRKLMYMEVLSSTDWSLDSSSNHFYPNYFVEVGEEGINEKILALKEYHGVLREYPHPRSEKAIMGLAFYRGSCAGLDMAEAFESVFSIA